MKKEYRKSRYSGSIVNGVRFWLILVVLVSSIGPISVSAKVVWEDNFDDGNYDGWTVKWGNFSAANYYLECTGINETSGRSLIIHESNVTTGTWSFDYYLSDDSHGIYAVPHRDNETLWHSWLLLMSSSISLWIREGENWNWKGRWYSAYMFNETWTHIDLTVNEDMIFNVFVNDIHRIHYNNASHLTGDYGYFVFEPVWEGQAIDNISVSDTIDFNPNVTTTTPTTPTTTTTTTTDGGFDMTTMLLVGGGIAAVVVIVLVVWKFRGEP